jgi:hypothetical protein
VCVCVCIHHLLQYLFRKHCAASLYLQRVDWLLVLDADVAVVNPRHCIEEYIDNTVELILYERFFNWEIASGNYIVKNTPRSIDFLQRYVCACVLHHILCSCSWANSMTWLIPQHTTMWHGEDNGVLQIMLLMRVMYNHTKEIQQCYELYLQSVNYSSYMMYVMCCNVRMRGIHTHTHTHTHTHAIQTIRAHTRRWEHTLLLHRAHAFVRDEIIAMNLWCANDFMFHGVHWKQSRIGSNEWASPFTVCVTCRLCILFIIYSMN